MATPSPLPSTEHASGTGVGVGGGVPSGSLSFNNGDQSHIVGSIFTGGPNHCRAGAGPISIHNHNIHISLQMQPSLQSSSPSSSRVLPRSRFGIRPPPTHRDRRRPTRVLSDRPPLYYATHTEGGVQRRQCDSPKFWRGAGPVGQNWESIPSPDEEDIRPEEEERARKRSRGEVQLL